MKNVLLTLALAFSLIVCALTVHVGPQNAQALLPIVPSGADSALAAAGSFKIYPLFSPGGAHMHAAQWVTDDNGYAPAKSGWIRTTLSSVRFNAYSSAPGADSSGFTILPGETYTKITDCDSIRVVNTGGTATTVTWVLYK